MVSSRSRDALVWSRYSQQSQSYTYHHTKPRNDAGPALEIAGIVGKEERQQHCHGVAQCQERQGSALACTREEDATRDVTTSDVRRQMSDVGFQSVEGSLPPSALLLANRLTSKPPSPRTTDLRSMYMVCFACMFVCMYVCMYVCTYVCMYVRTYVCMHE